MTTGTVSQLRREVFGDWEVLHRIAVPDRDVYTVKQSDGTHGILIAVHADRNVSELLAADVARCRDFDHPAIAKVLDHFALDDRELIVFEHIDGTSLHRLMKYFAEKNEGLGDRAALHIGSLLVDALAAAHQCRDAQGKVAPIIHGQLGPHQVLLSWEGDIKVMGLGLAAAFGGPDDEPEWLQAYMAPEVRDGGAMTARANVYTAGAMLWTLFSREPLPTDGSRPAPLRRTRPDLPASITFPIDRAMELSNKRISSKALAVSLSRTLDPADKEDLRWALEVCRVRVAVDEEFLPQESFPPKRTRSLRAMSSMPPDSDRPTTKMDGKELLDEARLIGPLPWERAAPDPETTAVSPAPANGPVSRIPRPSNSRRLGGRSRRARAVSSTDHGALTSASHPVPPKRARAETKRGLQDFVPRPVSAEAGHGELDHTQVLAGPPQGGGLDADGQAVGQPSTLLVDRWPAGASAQPSRGPEIGALPSVTYHHPHSHGPGPVSQVPLSYAPGGMPGYAFHTQAPPGLYAAPPPTKWLVAIAATAAASFAAGLIIASISGVHVQIGDSDTHAAAPPATSEPQPKVTATAEAAPAPVPVAKPDPKPEPEPAVEPEPEHVPSHHDSVIVDEAVVNKAREEARSLQFGVGMLLVRTSQPDAWVYVSGRPYSKAGVPFQVVCGPHHVRLGDENRSTWYDPGQSMTIACQTLNDVTIEPRPAPAHARRGIWPPPGAGGQFLK